MRASISTGWRRSPPSRGSMAKPRSRLIDETARQLALAMAYEDTVRVAELKIRPSRFARVREEVKVDDGQILEIAEFFHPRTQEIADTLPAGFGRWLLRTGWARGLVDRFTRKGRVVKTTSAPWVCAAVPAGGPQALAPALAAFRQRGCVDRGLAASRRGHRPHATSGSPSRSRARVPW